jgi:hypothetical protein
MPGSGWAVKFSGFAAMSKETFTATIELTDDEAARLRKTAAYFQQELSAFLCDALMRGIADAESHKEMFETPPDARGGEIIDDGIPF